MMAACPLPANHGTLAGIREAAEATVPKGHRLRIVIDHFGSGKVPQEVQIDRISNFCFSRKIMVGSTWQKPFLDLLVVLTLCRVVRREGIDLIHAHNYSCLCGT